ncbi:MAG: signal peptidase II [Patescibacteria group bacterium]|nr:signal peptidase II [Patescibacteria group bacterium]
MMTDFLKRKSCWLSLGVVVLVDQVTKGLVELGWWGGVTTINPGFAFGLGIESTVAQTIILALGWGLIGWILLTHFTKKYVYVGLFLGGGLSNLIDRIIWGGVRDWLSVPLMGMQNNLADWAIAIGLGGLLFDVWLRRK